MSNYLEPDVNISINVKVDKTCQLMLLKTLKDVAGFAKLI